MDQDDAQQGAPRGPSGPPAGTAAAPPVFTVDPAGPNQPNGSDGSDGSDGAITGRPGPLLEGPRPLPLVTSLAGAAGTVFLLYSLALFLSDLNGDSRRMAGLVVCLLFQGLGVGLMVLTRGRASTTAGVGLTALAVIPLVIYLFVDVDNPGKTIDSPSSFTNTATMILLASAAAWLVAYFVGPGRRYGIYLGGALVALWLVAVVQIVDNPVNQIFDPFASQSFGAETKFESVGSAIDDSYSPGSTYDPSTDTYYEDDFFSDTNAAPNDDYAEPSQDFGTDFGDEFTDDGFMSNDPYSSVEDPSTKLGWASLIFGGAYLALAAWRDRRGDARMGTPFVAVSAPILLVAIAFLSVDFGDTGTAMLAVAIGAAQIFVGTRHGRRFTSWIGLLVAASGVVALVEQAVGDSTKVSAIVLLILGVGVTVLALALDGGLNLSRDDGGPSDPAGPGIPPAGNGGPAFAAPAGDASWTAPPGSADPSPWSTPTGPPTAPPTSPPTGPGSEATPPAAPVAPWQPPTLQPPAAPPWQPSSPTSPTPDSAALWAPPTRDDDQPPTGNA